MEAGAIYTSISFALGRCRVPVVTDRSLSSASWLLWEANCFKSGRKEQRRKRGTACAFTMQHPHMLNKENNNLGTLPGVLAELCRQRMSLCLLWAGAPWASHLDGSPIPSSADGADTACCPVLLLQHCLGAVAKQIWEVDKGTCGGYVVTCVLRVFCVWEAVSLAGGSLFFQEVWKGMESSDWARGTGSILHTQEICLLGT